MVKPRRRSSGDASRLNRAALRRSALRFGRITPGPVLPVGAPPSRALSAGRLAPTGRTGRSRRSPGFHHRLLRRLQFMLTARGRSTPHYPHDGMRAESGDLCACGALPPRGDGANRSAIRAIVFGGEGKTPPHAPPPRRCAPRMDAARVSRPLGDSQTWRRPLGIAPLTSVSSGRRHDAQRGSGHCFRESRSRRRRPLHSP